MKKRERFKIVVALTSVTQAGLSALVPVVIFIFIAKELIQKFGFPEKTMIFAIIFGVLCGFYNMVKYIYLLINRKG